MLLLFLPGFSGFVPPPPPLSSSSSPFSSLRRFSRSLCGHCLLSSSPRAATAHSERCPEWGCLGCHHRYGPCHCFLQPGCPCWTRPSSPSPPHRRPPFPPAFSLPRLRSLPYVPPPTLSVCPSLPPLRLPGARTAQPPVIKGAHPFPTPTHPTPTRILATSAALCPRRARSGHHSPMAFRAVMCTERGALKFGEQYLNGFFHQASNHSARTYPEPLSLGPQEGGSY